MFLVYHLYIYVDATSSVFDQFIHTVYIS